jgi:hypothetical protein
MSKKQFHGFPLLLEKGLQLQMKDESIKIKELQNHSYYFGFITGKGFELITDRESEFKVGIIPLLINDKTKYWSSIGIEFVDANQSLKHVSISIYKDDDNRTKLFRAEWAKDDGHNSKHAQPHWHFHFDKTNKEDWNLVEDSPMFFEEEVIEKEANKLNEFHFAMASSWHAKNGGHSVDFEAVKSINEFNNQMVNWIIGTFDYIDFQLKHIHK